MFGLFDNTDTLLNAVVVTKKIVASAMLCTGIPRNKTVYATTIYDFVFTPNSNNPLPNTGYLTAYFPATWSNSAKSGTFTSPICTAPPTCNITNTKTIKIYSLFVADSTTSPFSLTIANMINPETPEINRDLLFVYSEGTG